MTGVDLVNVQRVYDEALTRVHHHLPDCVADVVIDVRFDGFPGHPHPMKPTLIDGTALWACPAAESVVARIGDWKY